MNTLQATLAFTAVFFTICAVILLNPVMYSRTDTMARLSVEAQDDNNVKKGVFEIRTQKKESQEWEIAVSCPEKVYRLGKGVRDSISIMIG